MEKIKISIIGAGRVGSTLAYLFNNIKNQDIKINCVASRTQQTLKKVENFLGPESEDILFTTDLGQAAADSNCIFLATPDDAIERITGNIFDGMEDCGEKYVIHFSGSKSLKALNKAKEAGAKVGCMHPIKSFASPEEAVKTIKGTVFGITYSQQSVKKLIVFFVELMEGSFIEVSDKTKPMYHAACCVASNYLVALMDYAVAINQKIGINPHDSVKALMGLVEGTLKNIKKMGTKESLTGPIARGDVGTIKDHLGNFSENDFNKEVYSIMGKRAAEIAYGNKWIDEQTYNSLIKVLEVDRNK